MDNQTFECIMARFDKVDADNKAQLERLSKHVDEDYKVHVVVQRHTTYWKFLSMGVPIMGAAIAKKLGWS